MSALTLQVPIADGERVRRWLLECGALDPARRIASDEKWLWIPLLSTPSELPAGTRVVDHALPSLSGGGPRDYRDLWAGPEEEKARLPRAFDVIGDIVLIRLPPDLRPRSAEIGKALQEFVPGARIVAEDRGVRGETRLRELHVIAGEGPLRTEYRENGLPFLVDVERCYFSPRLAREHAAFAGRVRPNDRILDLCSGLGPFGLTAARRAPGVTVTAVDVNPDAIALLRENAERLGVADRFDARAGDAEGELSRLGTFDRIVLNLPHAGARFLPLLPAHTAPGGALDYFEVVDDGLAPRRAEEILGTLGPSEWVLQEEVVVHEYSPGAVLRRYSFIRHLGPPR
jgi:tRNA (guanine37-N1)-methyltransferase